MLAAQMTVPVFVRKPPVVAAGEFPALWPEVAVLDAVDVPPCATVNEPPLTSPPAPQFITALDEMFNPPPIVPPDQLTTEFDSMVNAPLSEPPLRLTVPCNVPAPKKFRVNFPVSVSISPPLTTFQLMVDVPVPPVFCKVPTLMKVFVPN